MKSYEIISFLTAFGAIISFINTSNFTVLGVGIGLALLIYFGTKYVIQRFGDVPQ